MLEVKGQEMKGETEEEEEDEDAGKSKASEADDGPPSVNVYAPE